jgi:hypothetical protein
MPGRPLSSEPPLPPWLRGGGGGAPHGAGAPRRAGGRVWHRLAAPAMLLCGVAIGWWLHGRQPPPPPVAAAPAPEPPQCPPVPACGSAAPPAAAHAHTAHARPKTSSPPALIPLPDEGKLSEASRREALRAFAQQKAGDLRNCLGDPGRGPLRRVGAALEIDARGAVAAVQILDGENVNRAVTSCYSARLRSWRFPQALLEGDERLLVNFVL